MEIIEDKYIIKLVEDEIDVNEAIGGVNDSTCGAVSIFMGVTRRTESGDDPTDRPLECLFYEAYHSMAVKQMQTIVEQNMSRYSDKQIHRCFVVHRLGRVDVGQSSLVIACSAPHRTEAHELVLRLLNDIKAFVPIWKRIVYTSSGGTDGQTHEEWSDKSEAFWLKQ